MFAFLLALGASCGGVYGCRQGSRRSRLLLAVCGGIALILIPAIGGVLDEKLDRRDILFLQIAAGGVPLAMGWTIGALLSLLYRQTVSSERNSASKVLNDKTIGS
jgi:hypothetical protein